MNSLLLIGILVVTLVVQAAWPARRLVLVFSGAAFSCLVSSLSGGSTTRLLAGVPWDVLVILVGLGLVTELLAESRLFGLLAVGATRMTGARPLAVTLVFCVAMYVVSGLVNNLTALLLVLPILLILFRLLGVTQRYLIWTLGPLLVACNLGGAATPIGDFPAILLLGRGAMTFEDYLVRAAPITAVAVTALMVVVLLMGPTRGLPVTPLSRRLTVATLSALYRGVRLRPSLLVPGGVALTGMLVAWVVVPASSGIGPELICWLGTSVALLGASALGERMLRTRVDVEATLFLLGLFVMVGAVRDAGVFTEVARVLTTLPIPPTAQVMVFLVVAAFLTGLFSAGPSMAALLEVAEVLARQHSPEAIYVGLAMSVCAGSSLFLTAATSGPLTQVLVERSALKGPDGAVLRLGFLEFLPVGLIGFSLILTVGMVATLMAL